jgi:hypothetical protein
MESNIVLYGSRGRRARSEKAKESSALRQKGTKSVLRKNAGGDGGVLSIVSSLARAFSIILWWKIMQVFTNTEALSQTYF